MARFDPVDPRVRLAIAQWPPDALRGTVSTFCLEHAISRKTFYAIRRRALEEGQAAALEPRSPLLSLPWTIGRRHSTGRLRGFHDRAGPLGIHFGA
jgi:hypothetical protein